MYQKWSRLCRPRQPFYGSSLASCRSPDPDRHKIITRQHFVSWHHLFWKAIRLDPLLEWHGLPAPWAEIVLLHCHRKWNYYPGAPGPQEPLPPRYGRSGTGRGPSWCPSWSRTAPSPSPCRARCTPPPPWRTARGSAPCRTCPRGGSCQGGAPENIEFSE